MCVGLRSGDEPGADSHGVGTGGEGRGHRSGGADAAGGDDGSGVADRVEDGVEQREECGRTPDVAPGLDSLGHD